MGCIIKDIIDAGFEKKASVLAITPPNYIKAKPKSFRLKHDKAVPHPFLGQLEQQSQ